MSELTRDPWQSLRRFTNARIALGRAGNGQPTQALLAFGVAHAQARDAVHRPLAAEALHAALQTQGFATLDVHSAAPDRATYLRRPDLGRQLDEASRASLAGGPFDVVFVIADGLSALAVERHAAPLLQALRPSLAGWSVAPVVVARQARVALGDEVAALLHARMAVVLVGERPGLSSPDSLGVYATWAPSLGCMDSQRNCISNIRPEGLGYVAAAHKLAWLMDEVRRLQLSGVGLKDESGEPALVLPGV